MASIKRKRGEHSQPSNPKLLLLRKVKAWEEGVVGAVAQY